MDTCMDRLRDLLDRLAAEDIRDVVRDLATDPTSQERPYPYMVGFLQSTARLALAEHDRQKVKS